MKILPTLAAGALVLALGACSDDTGASDDASPSPSASASTTASSDQGVTVDITISKDDKVTPQGRRVEVKIGQPVTLHITAQTDEEIHVHSDPEHEYEVAAGDDVTKSFTLDTPGQVAVEAHHADVTIAQLVVRP